MKISPPAIAVFAPGISTGNRPTMAATVAPTSTWSSSIPSNWPTFEMA